MTRLEISQAGRYENVFLSGRMVASYDRKTEEFAIYNPHNDSEDPEYIIEP